VVIKRWGTDAKNNAVNSLNSSNTVTSVSLWRYGCLADGTMVTMADGTSKPVESLRVGDSILSDAKGTVRMVNTIFVKHMTNSLVKLVGGMGEEIAVSEDQPMVTSNGITLAKNLQIGDYLISQKGQTELVMISCELYGGNVWTVELVRDDKCSGEQMTFYANGLLAGDLQMQIWYWKRYMQETSGGQLNLPAEWELDRESYAKWQAEGEKK
jgi:hypothetical protein